MCYSDPKTCFDNYLYISLLSIASFQVVIIFITSINGLYLYALCITICFAKLDKRLELTTVRYSILYTIKKIYYFGKFVVILRNLTMAQLCGTKLSTISLYMTKTSRHIELCYSVIYDEIRHNLSDSAECASHLAFSAGAKVQLARRLLPVDVGNVLRLTSAQPPVGRQ